MASFSRNDVDEIHLTLTPTTQGPFESQLKQIIEAQLTLLNERGIPSNVFLFSRFFISDAANQSDALELIQRNYAERSPNAAISIIQQPPLSGSKVIAWSYIIHDRGQQSSHLIAQSANDLLYQRGDYQHLWSTRLTASIQEGDSGIQIDSIFSQYTQTLMQNGLSLKENCMRTWLFVKDIDYHYNGVVEARKHLFAAHDMTDQTHYIASTGIEGRQSNPAIHVSMDAYSVSGISSKQVNYLQAPKHLNPTHEYGVTFERGTSIDYGDRRHIFISGTASINNQGEILFRKNLEEQLNRTLENISALLDEAETRMEDIAQMIIYLRDLADAELVQQYFSEKYEKIPKAIVLAPVCRPGWLVEIECIAIKSIDHSSYPSF
ncbi:Rid family hydrolase [Coraliomargarita akajimensis]|nr:Rid family hydrolase [Coraliomargarita akajimensis]